MAGAPAPAPPPGYSAGGYGTGGYGPAPYPGGYGGTYASPSSSANTLAIVSLVCSVAGFLTYISALAGVICGHIALGQMKRSGDFEGRGMALAGVIVGYVVIIGGIIAFIAMFAWLGWLFDYTGY